MGVAKKLNGIVGHGAVLIICDARDLTMKTIEVIGSLVKTHDSGVVITVNQPYSVMKKLLEKEGTDTKGLYFIDCISAAAGGQPQKSKDCLYIQSPGALTEIGISVTQGLSLLNGKKKFVFIDSLGTFLMYNSAGTVKKFHHFLITKLKLAGVDGIFMLVESEMDRAVLLELESLCEKTINL